MCQGFMPVRYQKYRLFFSHRVSDIREHVSQNDGPEYSSYEYESAAEATELVGVAEGTEDRLVLHLEGAQVAHSTA